MSSKERATSRSRGRQEDSTILGGWKLYTELRCHRRDTINRSKERKIGDKKIEILQACLVRQMSLGLGASANETRINNTLLLTQMKKTERGVVKETTCRSAGLIMRAAHTDSKIYNVAAYSGNGQHRPRHDPLRSTCRSRIVHQLRFCRRLT